MSQKTREGYIFRVRAYAFFLEMPQNRTLSVSLNMLENLKMPHFRKET